MVSYFASSQQMPVAARVLVEGGFGEVAAQAVVNLPGDELRVLAEGLGHALDDALGVVPKHVAVEADRPARAFMLDQARAHPPAESPDASGPARSAARPWAWPAPL